MARQVRGLSALVTLNKIYTRTGDAGATRLATGQQVSKSSLRVETYGAVDEANACIGLARLHTGADAEFDAMLARVQNELFDLGADLATPPRPDETHALRMVESQVERLEREIDAMNAELPPLASFILPGGTPAAAHLHLARTVARRAERIAVALVESGESVSSTAMKYLNRLSDFLFVAARHANDRGASEVFWRSGATR